MDLWHSMNHSPAPPISHPHFVSPGQHDERMEQNNLNHQNRPPLLCFNAILQGFFRQKLSQLTVNFLNFPASHLNSRESVRAAFSNSMLHAIVK